MKKTLLFVAALFFSAISIAQDNGLNPIYQLKVHELEFKQDEKNNEPTASKVLNVINSVVSGTTKNTSHPEAAPSVSAMVQSVFSYVHRLSSVDEIQDTEEAYKLTGKITNLSTTSQNIQHENKDSKGKVTTTIEIQYNAHVSISLTMTNVMTNKTYSKSFSSYGESTGKMSSPDKAISAAVDRMKWDIVSYFNYMYPIRANVIEFGEDKKDKIKELYLDAGAAIGIHKDMHFELYLISQIAGRETKKKIGKVKVYEVSGDDICLCKVQKGSKEIKQAKDDGSKLTAICTE